MRVKGIQLENLFEALQQAQLEKASRLTGLDPDDILQRIALADPTVDSKDDAMQGKYAQWLVARLIQAIKDDRQAEWIKDNPRKAFEQGILGITPEKLQSWVTDVYLPQVRAGRNLYGSAENYKIHVISQRAEDVAAALKSQSDENTWIYGSEDVTRKMLEKFHRLSERNWLERAGLSPDINQWKNMAHLLLRLKDLGGPIKEIIEDPGDLSFDVAYKDDRGIYILGTSDAMTVQQLGKGA
ncbi:MAG: hypothetical protein GF311_27630, partial [Candidatus Lokiarchaeota archaeon]|nr:hypothetical protein [Candidatus Lokiarchaeota archaeon]